MQDLPPVTRRRTTDPMAAPVSVSLPRALRARLDELAARHSLARGVLLRECVERALPAVEARLRNDRYRERRRSAQ